MELKLSLVGIFFVIGTFGHPVSEPNTPNAIQILRIENHTLRFEKTELERILLTEEIKDRHIVVFSIAGSFRKGKSFILNFFLRYLNAQVNGSIRINDLFCSKYFKYYFN